MSAMEQTQEMPETKGGVVAYLSVDGAAKAAEFYAKAFGAEQVFAYPPDEKGRTMHVHLYINGSSVMLSDFYPEHGHAFEKPQGFTMHLIVDDIDAWWEHVSNTEGMKVELPLQKMFWGDRYATLRDPFGVLWALVGK
ncbi:VOC family protein [Nitratireductor thuwali]|uniref:VOC domain-containing protein n=1 Tax=Nitratireductor thuwali TaxID=2267699 RepID=A0ABY5MDX4_9HYPH|nr:hypothetical protein NTH_00698 [Nitratireductor thuwali]